MTNWLTATVELPLLDQNQAQGRRAEYELAERMKKGEVLVAEVGQEVRAALDKARVASPAAVFAIGEFVPRAERSASVAEKLYKLGDTTVLTLLQARRAAIEARRTANEALLEAALSRIEVERTTGAPSRVSPAAEVNP